MNNEKTAKSNSALKRAAVSKMAVCAAILGSVWFLKEKKPEQFDSFKLWYQENVCEEKYKIEDLKDDLIWKCLWLKDKACDTAARFSGSNFQ